MTDPRVDNNEQADPATWYTGGWHFPTEIVFGCGSRDQLIQHASTQGINKPLFVTDQGLVDLDITRSLVKNLQDQCVGLGVFSGVKPNPTGSNVEAGVKAYIEGGHDGVIVLGGGSALDVGKAIALMVGQQQDIWAFEDVGDNWEKVNVDGMAPVIAVPTTAGTGSEVGRSSVILDEAAQQKKIIFHPNMTPELVIIDPELTMALPSHITAATGVDAFVHNIEAFCVNGFHPMADGIALEGMRLIKENLLLACKDGNNIAARSNMLVASTMGATAFQKGLGGVHALAHPLGALYDKHHGLLNAIILPFVLKRNRSAIEKKISVIANFIGVEQVQSSADGFDGFIDWVLAFREALGIPHTLSSIDIGLDDAKRVGQMAAVDPAASGNPIQFSADDYTEIFKDAVDGREFG